MPAATAYGDIAGSKPAGLPAAKKGENLNLNTTDILGAQANTKGKGPFTWCSRKDVREMNKTSDIEGCKADTLKRAPDTKRCLNPLDPSYVVPGAGERPVDDLNDPYNMKHSSMGNANFSKCKNEGPSALKSNGRPASAAVISQASSKS
jgi:hypothetical protein